MTGTWGAPSGEKRVLTASVEARGLAKAVLVDTGTSTQHQLAPLAVHSFFEPRRRHSRVHQQVMQSGSRAGGQRGSYRGSACAARHHERFTPRHIKLGSSGSRSGPACTSYCEYPTAGRDGPKATNALIFPQLRLVLPPDSARSRAGPTRLRLSEWVQECLPARPPLRQSPGFCPSSL